MLGEGLRVRGRVEGDGDLIVEATIEGDEVDERVVRVERALRQLLAR